MPKPFKFAVEVEESLGLKIIRSLNKMPGVVALHLDLDQERKAPAERAKPNGKTRLKNGHVVPALLTMLLKDGDSFTPKQFSEAHVAVGRSASSASSALTKLKHDGLFKNVKPGLWRITAKGKKAAAQAVE